MKRNILLLAMFSAYCLSGLGQSSQTKTATLYNCFGEAYLNVWAQGNSDYLAKDDNVYAYTQKLSSGRGVVQLLLQGFGFTIPSGATIQNITVSARRFKKGKGSIRDYFAHLVRYDNNIGRFNFYGVFWRDLNGNYPDTEGVVYYSQSGSGTNGGGQGNQPYQWTPEMINDPAFGLRLNTYEPVSGSVVVYYDLVQITVQYSSPAVTRRVADVAENVSLEAPVIYPNPFTMSTRIRFTAAETGNALVELYDIAGVKISALFSGSVIQGQEYHVVAGKGQLAKGIYLYRITNGKQNYTGRIIKLE